ncbi:MAG: isocitrate lyase/PEP mutase family protein [Microvirga sp.]
MKKSIRALLCDHPILVSPGVYDGYSARLAERAGFDLLSTTGAGLVNSRLGLPDVGLFSFRDNLDACRAIAGASSLPVSADAETGYGNAATVHYVVKSFEEAGVSAVSLEDQVAPKRCGHLAGKDVISLDEMVGKIRSAVHARRDPDFLIVARTDAIAVEGIEGAVARARAYEAAGADAIFPDAVRGQEDIERIVAAVGIPVRINMGFGIRTRSTTPLMTIPALRALGVRWVSLSRMLPAAAIHGMVQALQAMRDAMGSEVVVERPDLVADMSTITDLMGYAEYLEIERRFVPEPEVERRRRHPGERP